MSRYALQGTTSRDLLTYGGKVLVHDSRPELEFLVAGDVHIVECPRDIPPDQTLPIRFHPQLTSVTWPLTKEQFR